VHQIYITENIQLYFLIPDSYNIWYVTIVSFMLQSERLYYH